MTIFGEAMVESYESERRRALPNREINWRQAFRKIGSLQ
jgi:hypothetical protein